MATKMSMDGILKPAPLWWRRLERSLLIVFIPAAVIVVQSWGFDDDLKTARALLIINVVLTAVIKGVGMMLSNGEIYQNESDPKP